jgi:hypothetical protein
MTKKIVKFNEEKQKRAHDKFGQEQRMIADCGTKISVKHTVNKEGQPVIEMLKIKDGS